MRVVGKQGPALDSAPDARVVRILDVLASAPESYVQTDLESGESGPSGWCEAHRWVGFTECRQSTLFRVRDGKHPPEDSSDHHCLLKAMRSTTMVGLSIFPGTRSNGRLDPIDGTEVPGY